MTKIERMDESIFKREIKTEHLDKELKIESNENLEIQAGMDIIERMNKPICKNEPKTVSYDKKVKIEPKDDTTEVQTKNELNSKIEVKSEFFDVKVKLEPRDEFDSEFLVKQPKIESKENLEIQAGMAIIERMGESKTEPYNKKLKIEPKDDSDSELQIMNMPAFKKEVKSEFLDVKVKLEARDEFELQAGLTILDKMDQSIFNKKMNIETFENNSRITIKKEVEDKDSEARPKFWEKISNVKKIALNFKCIACDDTFESLSEVDFHEKRFHQSIFKKKKKIETFENNSKDKDSQARPKFLEKLSAIKKIALNFNCNACDDTFKDLHEVAIHEKRFHSHVNGSDMKERDWIFKCNVCSINFQQFTELKAHVIVVHPHLTKTGKHEHPYSTKIRNFECKECKTTFKTQAELIVHPHLTKTGKYEHPNSTKIRKFECKECKKTFKTQAKLNRHTKKNCRSKPWPPNSEKCSPLKRDIQGKPLEGLQKFKLHGQKFGCNLCKFLYSNLEELHRHSTRSHGNLKMKLMEKKDWIFKCYECDRNYQYFETLKFHVKVKSQVYA